MPPVSGHKKLTEAVFTSINEGSYAVNQDVASAELNSTALQSLSTLLDEARVEVKNSISELSRLSAADIDGWISQAKQLRWDINQSEQQSREITIFAENDRGLRQQVKDITAKVKLLETEVTFNDTVVGTLNEVQRIQQLAEATKGKLDSGHLLDAAKYLVQAEVQAKALQSYTGTRLGKVVEERLGKLRYAVVEIAEKEWSRLIEVDEEQHSLTIRERHTVEDGRAESSSVTLSEVAQTLAVVDLLQERISVWVKIVDQAICQPLTIAPSSSSQLVTINENVLKLTTSSHRWTTETTFKNLQALQDFCQERLPSTVLEPFMLKINTSITDRLIKTTLPSVVPIGISDLPAFEQTIEQIRSFAKSRNTSKGSRQSLLRWADNAPNVWLERRTEGSLNSMRQILKRGLGRSRQVERVETQIVRQDDQAFAKNGSQNDWDADWSDDEKEDASPEQQQTPLRKNGTHSNTDEEDVSGWDFDDDNEDTATKQPTKILVDGQPGEQTGEEEDEGDAWGWGEGDETEVTEAPITAMPAQTKYTATETPATRTPKRSAKPTERQITLREKYHVTALPEQILDVIMLVINDADFLSTSRSVPIFESRIINSSSVQSPISSAAEGLYLLASYLLAMFRATTPVFYLNDINGGMFLYNDSLRIVGELRSNIDGRYTSDKSLENLLQIDLPNLELFGKRAYGKDMESKRTILVDLLDGAQGFSNCTQEPFASQCDLAVSSVIDYLRQIHGQWSRVLSQSALLQSIGSLLTTITNKMIIDIEDMSDISEPESQRLVSFCKSITSLEDLFLSEADPKKPQEEQVVPLTAGYSKTWLRFQYLSNILESSLADIKYLWIEGELSYEFTVDEVVDLIEALFADSDHRRRAIAEIRRVR